jgi:hypothetical protein
MKAKFTLLKFKMQSYSYLVLPIFSTLSFPRKRESILPQRLDSRFRGNDKVENTEITR